MVGLWLVVNRWPRNMSKLILPGNPLFDFTLDTTPPPGWQSSIAVDGFAGFVISASGLMRPATPDELDEYLDGGEYDERMTDVDTDWCNGEMV